jgi:hypothetical protein
MIETLKGEYPPLVVTDKINELVRTVNYLGSVIDEFTGCAPEFRPRLPKKPLPGSGLP